MSTLVLALRMVLAAVFVVAAVGKLLDLQGSRRAARDFGVPKGADAAVGLLLPLAELAIALALVLQPSARWGAVAALLVLLAFIAGIAAALRRGEEPDCHCFGQIHSSPAGPGTLVRNAALAALAAVIVVEGPGPAVDAWVGDRTAAELAAVGAGAGALLLGLLALQLWHERREMRGELSTARRMAATAPPGIPIGSPAPEFSLASLDGDTVSMASLLERGQPVLLVFLGPNCESCLELLPKLARWQQSLRERLTIALVSTGGLERNREMVAGHEVHDLLLQEGTELVEAYRIRGTPSAVIVTSEGKVASNPAETVFGIEPMLRVALRDGAGSMVEGSVV